jgi:hypothetical protein
MSDFDWKSLLKSVAPTAATLLGGPLAGMAVEAIASAIGDPNATKEQVIEKLQAGTLTAEQMTALKAAEANLKIKLRELDIDLEKVHAADRASARDMAAKTGDVWTPRVLAFVVLITWGFVQYHLLTAVVDASMRELVARLLGTLDAALMAVLYYYYGSSAGSAAKNEALAKK